MLREIVKGIKRIGMKLIELTKEKSNEVKNKSYPIIKNISLGVPWWFSG